MVAKKTELESKRRNAKGLWIDHPHLPTNLAQKARKQPPLSVESAPRIKKDVPHSRILALADVALGNKRVGNRRKAG